jgi:hypothetical protein
MAQVLVQTNSVAVGFNVQRDPEIHDLLLELYSIDYPQMPEPVLGVAIVFNKEKDNEVAGVPVGVVFDADVLGDDLAVARQGITTTFGLLKKLKYSLEQESLDTESDEFLKMITGEYQRCVDVMHQLVDENLMAAQSIVVH